MNREDFNMLNGNLIYLDNAATTLKPKSVIDGINDYYNNASVNIHRGDYNLSLKVENEYELVREKVRSFINCDNSNEIIFTSGTTDSLNRIVFGFMRKILKTGDEVLLTKAEHASNILPWIKLSEEIGIVIRYIELDNNLLTVEKVKEAITPNTRVISIAHVTNVLGDIRPIKEIGSLAHQNNIYMVVDGAQSVPHIKVDVKDLNIDFLAFSAHKMLGPTGVGVLYGKYSLLELMEPLTLGGGMNASFDSIGNYEYKSIPTRFEAGTPNIAGVLGLGKAIDYINSIGIDNITKHELELKRYFIEKSKDIPNLIIYNKDIPGSMIAFNIDGVFSQDTALYLNHYNVCVRAGNHCAKILKDEIDVKNTCRISFYFYNTFEEIDRVIELLRNNKEIFNIFL